MTLLPSVAARGHAHLREQLIIALDLPSVAAAERVVQALGDTVVFYKVGLELTYSGGLDLAARLIGAGKKVFLDLKLHDIPNTVERAAAQVGQLGAAFLTVHAFPQTMTAAVRGLAGSATTILAVTVMTSYDDADLAEAGYALGVKDLVARRAAQAKRAGIGGLVLAAEEVATMRVMVGRNMILVTPGIRPAGAANADQKRVMTPREAIRAGADHLVIGRPVTLSDDPRAAAAAIINEMAAAQKP